MQLITSVRHFVEPEKLSEMAGALRQPEFLQGLKEWVRQSKLPLDFGTRFGSHVDKASAFQSAAQTTFKGLLIVLVNLVLRAKAMLRCSTPSWDTLVQDTPEFVNRSQ